MIGLVDYIACCPGGRRGEQQPFFYPPHHTTAPPPPFLRRSAMTHVHVHSMHTHRLQEYTYCSPSVRRHRPLHSGAEWQSHKKSSTNWSIRPPLRFVFRSRSFFPGFVSSVRSSAAGHTAQPQNELHKVRIEVRNPIKMLQPYFLFLWKRVEFPILWFVPFNCHVLSLICHFSYHRAKKGWPKVVVFLVLNLFLTKSETLVKTVFPSLVHTIKK